MKILRPAFLVLGISVIGATLLTMPARAATFFEIGDAGDTFSNAQVVKDSSNSLLDKIEGTLESTTDKDFFRFLFKNTGSLTIETGPYFNTPFPSNSFPAFELFNANNTLVGGYLNGFFTVGIGEFPGSLINYVDGVAQLNFLKLLAGEYVLKVDGTGQVNFPQPIYESKYAMSLSDANFFPSKPVPEPSTLVGIVIASSMSWLIKKKTLTSKG